MPSPCSGDGVGGTAASGQHHDRPTAVEASRDVGVGDLAAVDQQGDRSPVARNCSGDVRDPRCSSPHRDPGTMRNRVWFGSNPAASGEALSPSGPTTVPSAATPTSGNRPPNWARAWPIERMTPESVPPSITTASRSSTMGMTSFRSTSAAASKSFSAMRPAPPTTTTTIRPRRRPARSSAFAISSVLEMRMCGAESPPACSFMPLPPLPTAPSCQILDTSSPARSCPFQRSGVSAYDGLGSATYGRESGRRE